VKIGNAVAATPASFKQAVAAIAKVAPVPVPAPSVEVNLLEAINGGMIAILYSPPFKVLIGLVY
jgi:hypothetical protein